MGERATMRITWVISQEEFGEQFRNNKDIVTVGRNYEENFELIAYCQKYPNPHT